MPSSTLPWWPRCRVPGPTPGRTSWSFPAMAIPCCLARSCAFSWEAGLEVALDFPDEEIGASRPGALKGMCDLAASLERLVSAARQGRAVQDGLSVMLAGAPNVGKSSLLNRLLGSERAIVSATPGTTRDLVDGTLLIEGVPVRIVDGAGLGAPRDAIDAEGMRRARQSLIASDLVLVVLDRSRPLSVFDREILD